MVSDLTRLWRGIHYERDAAAGHRCHHPLVCGSRLVGWWLERKHATGICETQGLKPETPGMVPKFPSEFGQIIDFFVGT